MMQIADASRIPAFQFESDETKPDFYQLEKGENESKIVSGASKDDDEMKEIRHVNGSRVMAL